MTNIFNLKRRSLGFVPALFPIRDPTMPGVLVLDFGRALFAILVRFLRELVSLSTTITVGHGRVYRPSLIMPAWPMKDVDSINRVSNYPLRVFYHPFFKIFFYFIWPIILGYAVMLTYVVDILCPTRFKIDFVAGLDAMKLPVEHRRYVFWVVPWR